MPRGRPKGSFKNKVLDLIPGQKEKREEAEALKANRTEEEIIKEYKENLDLKTLPTHLYDQLFDLVSADWKQRLNPDVLFNPGIAESGLKALMPYISLGLGILTLIVLFVKK